MSAPASTLTQAPEITEDMAPPALLEEYRQWKAMGAGGVSFDFVGFMQGKTLEKTMARDDTTNLTLYDEPEKYAKGWKKATDIQRQNAYKSFLKATLPQREGPRSRALHFVFPQRERFADVAHPPEVKEVWQTAFETLAKTPNTEVKTSCLEKRGPALFTTESVPLTPLAGPTQREICHIHSTDLSGHVTLSFVDAKEVISKGWGERHRLSGTDFLHLGYTMLYVPNTVEEAEILASIFQAGVDYMMSG